MKKMMFIITIFLYSISLTKAAPCEILNGDGTKIGDEIKCYEEIFYVIAVDENTTTLLSKYNLDKEYKQSLEINEVTFANKCNWPYKPGPLEVNIDNHEGNVQEYLLNYKEYLKSILKENIISVDLITLKDLKNIGCTINDDYTYSSNLTCTDSEYANWIINNQWWWTKSAYSTEHDRVFIISDTGKISYGGGCYFANGIRPVIKLSSEILKPKKIILNADSNGTINIIESSIPGEKVKYQVTPKEGYQIKEIRLIDEFNNITILNDLEFIMPNSDVTIEVIFEKITDTSETEDEPEIKDDTIIEDEPETKDDTILKEESETKDDATIEDESETKKDSIVENPNTISTSIIASILFATISFVTIKINYKKMKWLNE